MTNRTVLLIGDSIFDLHEGEKRLEFVLCSRLRLQVPGYGWTICNEAHGGEYIGPPEGEPEGVSEPLFDTRTTGRYFDILHRNPAPDFVCVNYGANDSKVYSPSGFRERLEAMTAQLERDYPGARLVFSTTMYVDPQHSMPYTRKDPKVAGFRNGSSRNEYLAPYNAEIREHVLAHGHGIADLCRRIQEETAAGNWDLRMRADGGSPRDDGLHAGDLAWFDNIHPNDAGTEIVADALTLALREAAARP